MSEALARGGSRTRLLSRADLAWALSEQGEPGLAAMALLTGFTERERSPEREEKAADPPEPPLVPQINRTPTPAPESFAPVPFWRLERVEHLADPETPREEGLAPLTSAEVGPLALGADLRQPEILPWPALHRSLLTVLRSPREGRRLDLPRLVRAWSRAQLVARLPHRPAVAWSPRLTVLCDRSLRLVPLRQDQNELVLRLLRTYGEGGLALHLRLPEAPCAWTDARTWRRQELPRVEPGEPVLALSDLGLGSGDAAERAVWEELGLRLRAAGARPHALVPLPSERWGGSAPSSWNLLEWIPSPAPGTRRVPEGSEPDMDLRRESLLTYLALAVRIEPGLLREMRRLVPAADVGTELDAWNALGAANVSVVAARLERDLAERLRQGWVRLPEPERAATLRVLKRWHGSLARELWYEEVWTADTLGALPPGFEEDRAAARSFALRLAVTHQTSGPVEGALLESSQAWALRFSARAPPAIWQDPELGPALGPVVAKALRESGAQTLPPGFSFRWGTTQGSPRRWVVWQVGEEVRLRPEGDPGTPGERGSPLAAIVASSPEVAVSRGVSQPAEVLALAEGGTARPLRPGPFVLHSDRQELHFARYQREPWANAGAGRDKFGLWAAFEVKGVVQKMRWIPPGRFWMGSPETEQGRWDDEGPRHLVTVTEGFWLGETPVTQALWQVVMGENPSRFQSEDRPVEQISWNQCHGFLNRVNGTQEALGLRLPWEAEWEYSCRAGTEMSTYAGELVIKGERDGPALHAIAWYGGNSGVDFDLPGAGYDSSSWPQKQFEHTEAGTRRVKGKRPNAWGLYDMLGNVWEWCQDHGEYGAPYSPETVPYPRGSEVGSGRVLRGGSWGNVAWLVRAAVRGWDSPGSRGSALGFRLARGQGAQPLGGAPERAGEPRGRGAPASGEGRAHAGARRTRGAGEVGA